jgi:anti-sigma B factor antagonist
VSIEEWREGNMTVIAVHGPLASGGTDGDLRRAIRTALDGGAQHIVLNLQDVNDIDSSGVAELASAHITTNNRGGTLNLCCLSRKLAHIFAITRLQDVFAIFVSEADARAAAARR